MSAGSHSLHSRAQTRGSGAAPRVWLRRVLFGLIGLLYLASIPWYRDPDAPLNIVFGLPDWVAVAIGCYAAAACLNAVAWLVRAGEEEDDPGAASSESRE